MTCRNCYHYNVCVNETNRDTALRDGAERCKNFKNKAKVLELPCAIGDEAYIIVRANRKDPFEGFINTVTVVGMHLFDEKDRKGLRRKEYLVVRGSCGFSNHINIDKIGRTIFFNKYEAQEYLMRLKEISYYIKRDSQVTSEEEDK